MTVAVRVSRIGIRSTRSPFLSVCILNCIVANSIPSRGAKEVRMVHSAVSMTDTKMITCIGLNGEKTEVPLDQLTFRPSVFAVIVKDGKVLLSSQWDGWDFPGGGVHMDESIDEALEREVQQEIGLSVKRDKILHVSDHFFTHPNGNRHFHSVLMYFSCKDINGELSATGVNDQEKIYVREAKWIPLDEIDSLKFYNQIDSPTLIRAAAVSRGI